MSTHEKQHIGIIGNGSFAIALAYKLAQNHHQLTIWGRNHEKLKRAQNQLFKTEIDKHQIDFTTDWQQLYQPSLHALLIVVSSTGFASIIEKLKQHPPPLLEVKKIAWASKGLHQNAPQSVYLSFFSDLVLRQLNVQGCFITGPSFASELMNNKPTAFVSAGETNLAQYWSDCLHSDSIRCYVNPNQKTAELGAAMKNVIAIAVGVSDGLGLGSNARAALITRGLNEMQRVVQHHRGDNATLYGLSGLGDVMLTSTDDLSRNRCYGKTLAKNEDFTGLVEGVYATKRLTQLARVANLDLPICFAVEALIEGRISPLQATQLLLQRQPVAELIPL